jgi:predicted phage terminase large subunit-like protein
MTPNEGIMKIAQRARYDLYFLCKYVLGYELMEEEVHGDLCKYVETLLPGHPEDYVPPEIIEGKGLNDSFDARKKNILILMPRGTFKSSVVTIGFSLQIALNEPNARILIDSETQSKAKAFLSETKGHLETNELYRSVFKSIHGVYPDGVSTKRNKDLLWTNQEIVLASRSKPLKEPSIMVSGIDKSINGMHYDYIIGDDLHSEKNVTNSEQIQQVVDHWKLLYSLLDPGKVLIIIGTRWHFVDLYQEILDNHRDDYNVIIRKAIKKDGEAFFPQRLPLEELEKIKQKQGSAHFSNQYMNEPISADDATFKRENLEKARIDWELVKDQPMNWYMMVDPSFEGPYSDRAALVVGGMNHLRDIFARHIVAQKMNYSKLIDAIFNLNATYKPKTIAVKTVSSAGKSFMYELNNEQKRRGVWLPIRELKDNKNKEDRIRGLAPLYEYGHAHHVKGTSQLLDLEDELLKFPVGSTDDIIDAWASILEIATPPNSRTVHSDDREKKPGLPYKPRSFITGV